MDSIQVSEIGELIGLIEKPLGGRQVTYMEREYQILGIASVCILRRKMVVGEAGRGSVYGSVQSRFLSIKLNTDGGTMAAQLRKHGQIMPWSVTILRPLWTYCP
jgi:hypothetical protein